MVIQKKQGSPRVALSQPETHETMLKRLRSRFVALIVVALALVLTVTFAVLTIMEWQSDQTELEDGLCLGIEWARQADRGASLEINSRIVGGPSKNKHDGQVPFARAVYKLSSSDDGTTRDSALVSFASSVELDSDVLQRAVEELEERGLLSAVASSAPGQGLDQKEGIQKGHGKDLVSLRSLGLVCVIQFFPEGAYVAFADASLADGWVSLALMFAIAEAVLLLLFLVVSIFFARWALKPVDDAWKRQQDFIADASHELKTPLTIIMANTALALKNPDRTIESQRRWLESTQREAKDMQDLVADMLELAGLDAGVSFRDFEKIDFSELVEGDLLQFESLLFERGVLLEESIAQDVCVFGQRARVQRLVGALLDNASKYARSKIKVSLQRIGQQACLSVSNDGAAIPEDELPLVFDRFYRADKARTRTGGSGLGLSIAREIVQAHGGSISLSSRPLPNGQADTTFSVMLPIVNS